MVREFLDCVFFISSFALSCIECCIMLIAEALSAAVADTLLSLFRRLNGPYFLSLLGV